MNKKNGIKILSLIILTFLIGFAGLDKVYAASGKISVTSNSSTVVVGNTVTVNVTLSSSANLGSWEFCIAYDTSRLRLTSSTLDTGAACMKAGWNSTSSGNQKSASYTMKFKALKSGSANVYVNDATVHDYDGSAMSITKGSKTFTLKTQAEIEASYSKNNYLKSLSVDGVSLSPVFNKDTLQYSVELPAETEKIKVDATKEDSSASISGAGEIKVTEGSNKIAVVVTAENGSKREYIITATVKELDPIIVKVDGKDYTVIRKADILKSPELYTTAKATINGEEVPAFHSDITKYTLVGLKDEAGNIGLYIYTDNSYTKYIELTFGGVVLSIMEAKKEIPQGYEKCSTVINDEEVICYKHDDGDFILVYGMNVETGNEGFYVYDKLENTLQRYNEVAIKNQEDKATIYLIVAAIFAGTLVLTIIISLISYSKKKRKLRKYKNSVNKLEKVNKN